MRGLYILLVFLLSSCSCQSQSVVSNTRELPSIEEIVVEEKEAKNYVEILIERPIYRPLLRKKKIEQDSVGVNKLVEPITEDAKDQKEVEKKIAEVAGEKTEENPEDHELPLSEEQTNKKEQPDNEEDIKQDSFIFQPYYSAAIGSQGLFDDVDSATEEGWRISEMEAPSDYLGFTPGGWEVYPIWYYTSPTDSVKYYTLNFYP